LEYSDTSALLVDLSNVNVMNSSGLGMLVGALRNMQKKNISMALVSTPDIVISLLEMTHLKKVFKIFESIDDAVSNLE
jgi:anti-anti-sigma factor